MSDLRKRLDRRGFIKQAVQAGTGVGVGGALLGVTTLPTLSRGASALAETSTSRSHGNVASAPNRSLALDGEWSIATDPGNSGREQRWSVRTASQASKTKVPSIIQEVFPAYHGVVWYWREFRVPIHPDKLGLFLLRFDAVDYMADVWINGVHVGGHEGSETPFVLDVTTAVKPNTTNLAAVRVLNPGSERIDGIALKETPHRNKFFPFFSGASYDSGGIIGSVRLTMVPGVRVEDLFVQPDWKTGKIRVQSNLQNALGNTTQARLYLTVAPDATGAPVASVYHDIKVKPGENRVTAELQVHQPHLWDLQDPYLY